MYDKIHYKLKKKNKQTNRKKNKIGKKILLMCTIIFRINYLLNVFCKKKKTQISYSKATQLRRNANSLLLKLEI